MAVEEVLNNPNPQWITTNFNLNLKGWQTTTYVRGGSLVVVDYNGQVLQVFLNNNEVQVLPQSGKNIYMPGVYYGWRD